MPTRVGVVVIRAAPLLLPVKNGFGPICKRPTIGNDVLHEIGGRLDERRRIRLQRIRLIDMRERIDKGLSGLIVQFLD